MAVLRVIVTVLYVLICIALVALVLFQESKTQGLSGTINGDSSIKSESGDVYIDLFGFKSDYNFN